VEEIQAIARMSGATGVIDEQESELIQKASQLNDIRVREIIIPRTDIVGIEVSMQLSRIRTLVQAGQYSRLPVYKGDLDDVVGILHFKEFLSYAPQKDQAFDLVGFLHKPLFVPESMFIGDLLKQMQARRTHIAVVLDEYGGTSGLITIEDVVEMLVGRIEDEYDAVSVPFEQVDETTWDVDGRVTDDALFEQLGLTPEPGVTEGFHTVAGLALTAFGNIPAQGEKTAYHGMEITALSVHGNRVIRVRVRKLREDEIPTEDALHEARLSSRRAGTREVKPEPEHNDG
jgi:putative hemolysin